LFVEVLVKIKAHPTMYKNILFRSRLEAKWAAYFDQRGWHWTYEPFDLKGYSPDFTLEDGTLIEVKPITKPGQAKGPASRIVRAGWKGPWMVVGSDPDACMEGVGRHKHRRRKLGTEAPQAWAAACNLTQWMPTKSPGLPVCPQCGRQDHLLHKRVCTGRPK
jgi:hypothetical protein